MQRTLESVDFFFKSHQYIFRMSLANGPIEVKHVKILFCYFSCQGHLNEKWSFPLYEGILLDGSQLCSSLGSVEAVQLDQQGPRSKPEENHSAVSPSLDLGIQKVSLQGVFHRLLWTCLLNHQKIKISWALTTCQKYIWTHSTVEIILQIRNYCIIIQVKN